MIGIEHSSDSYKFYNANERVCFRHRLARQLVKRPWISKARLEQISQVDFIGRLVRLINVLLMFESVFEGRLEIFQHDHHTQPAANSSRLSREQKTSANLFASVR